MQEDFDLESVLTVVTGVNCTNDFEKVIDLFSFIFEDPLISMDKIIFLKNTAKNHILKIHPELKNISFDKDIIFNNGDKGIIFNKWINAQKVRFGDTVTVSVIGEPIIRLEKRSMSLR